MKEYRIGIINNRVVAKLRIFRDIPSPPQAGREYPVTSANLT